MNSLGNIAVNCVKVGATCIKVKDTQSGEVKYSGTITVNPVIADYFEKGGVRYHVTDKEVRHVSVTARTDASNCTDYTGATLTIPKEVTYEAVSYTVTDVKKCYYWGNTLKKVTLPAGLKIIGWSVFQFCRNLETFVLPDSVEYIDIDSGYGISKADIDNTKVMSRLPPQLSQRFSP